MRTETSPNPEDICMANVSKPWEEDGGGLTVWRISITVYFLHFLVSTPYPQPRNSPSPYADIPPLTSLPREHLLLHFTVVGHMSWKMWDALMQNNIAGKVDVIGHSTGCALGALTASCS